MRSLRVLFGVVLVCQFAAVGLPGTSGAQLRKNADPPEEPKKLNDLIEGSINWYDVYPTPDSTSRLTPQPVLRWRNVARGQEGEAMMTVWAHNGRPVALVSIYPWQGKMCHEFESLSRESKVNAREKDRLIWSPAAAGVEFKDVPNAPKPAKTAAGRLRQMKAIAEGFQATMTGWQGDNADQESLRLLTRPLHQYDLSTAKEPDAKLLDGGLFAYVQGTDPEVVLVLEAIGTTDEAIWQYAFVRATSGGLEVKLGSEVVWSAKKYPANRDPRLPHFTMQRVLEK